MPSPFPGMDPFLEEPSDWKAFHQHLVSALYQVLLPGLVDRYRARIGTRQYTSEVPLFTSMIREAHSEDFVEIRHRSDGRLVTLVEVVTPANRTTPAGRAAYLAHREQASTAHAGVVEIDLITQGKPLLDFPRTGLPEYDSAVTVTRGVSPDRYEIYTTALPKRLPKFRLPLAADDRDTVVDLQVAVARAYDQGDFAKSLHYAHPLPVDAIYTAETRKWIAEYLRLQKVK